MCYTDTLASLQAAVLEGVKIDSSDKTDNTTMQAIESHITEFVNNVANHNHEALTAFKQLEVFVAEQRRLLTSNVASAKKHTEAEERRAEVNRKAEAKRIEKEAAAADRKAQAELKKARKAALRSILTKYVKKPKSPIAGKTDGEVKKWGMIGAKNNFAPIRKANNKARREEKKRDKEEAAAARKLANAGKPKNAAYSKFCSWFAADGAEIEDAGFENKRDYNKFVWAEGLDGLEYDDWDTFKRSPEAPWNAAK